MVLGIKLALCDFRLVDFLGLGRIPGDCLMYAYEMDVYPVFQYPSARENESQYSSLSPKLFVYPTSSQLLTPGLHTHEGNL